MVLIFLDCIDSFSVENSVRLFCRNVLDVNGGVGHAVASNATESHHDDQKHAISTENESESENHAEEAHGADGATNNAANQEIALKPIPPVDLVCAYNSAVGYFHTRAALLQVRVSRPHHRASLAYFYHKILTKYA